MKINKKRVLATMLFLISLSIVLHDMYKLTIEPIFTSYLTGFTFIGFITFILNIYLLDISCEYIKKELSTNTIANVSR